MYSYDMEDFERMAKNNKMLPEEIEAIDVPDNTNEKMCFTCKGKCCVHFGGDIYPQDVKKWFNTDTITIDMIVTLLRSGMVQIKYTECYVSDIMPQVLDKYENVDRRGCYTLCMREGCSTIDYIESGNCGCYNYYHGCMLPWEFRPTGCKAIIPTETRLCNCREYKNLNFYTCMVAWIPYTDILREIIYDYTDYDFDEYINIPSHLDRRVYIKNSCDAYNYIKYTQDECKVLFGITTFKYKELKSGDIFRVTLHFDDPSELKYDDYYYDYDNDEYHKIEVYTAEYVVTNMKDPKYGKNFIAVNNKTGKVINPEDYKTDWENIGELEVNKVI